MSRWSRVRNVFRSERLCTDLDEELQSHLKEAIENGRDPVEARRAFGSMLRYREESRDARIISWLDGLRADAVFGWRQLKKSKVTSLAAILSLGLGIGACTACFRLIDAVLLRPLPVAHPERLHVIAFEPRVGVTGYPNVFDSCSYPLFRAMRDAVKDDADLIAVSYSERTDLTYKTDEEMEKAYRQYVSGSMFNTFGLQPALGRLLTPDDDGQPGMHPYAVLSYDYWKTRFGRNPNIIGRTFRMDNNLYEIVGIGPEGFTGTETGTVVDIFVPMAMKTPTTLVSPNNFWLRTLVLLNPGVAADAVRGKVRTVYAISEAERAKTLPQTSQRLRSQFFNQKLLLEPAAAGRSNLQRDYRRSLVAIALLVGLVLLIACANVANLMTGQAAARGREMAIRVALGGGRWRLMQLVLVEGAWLGFLSSALGGILAWWSAPVIVRMINPPDSPVRLVLPLDLRVVVFDLTLTLGVTLLFGLAPSLNTSQIKPTGALKGGENPHSRRRMMHSLIAAQSAFCSLVLFVACLLVTSFERLSNQPTGFSADRVLNLETLSHQPESPVFWEQVARRLSSAPGIEASGLTGWPLMSGESMIDYVSTYGAPPSEVFSDFLLVSPGWIDTMKIPLLDGRDFLPGEANPNVAIVNESFAKEYFDGASPVGKWFDTVKADGRRIRYQIVGYVRDARSRDNLRVPIRPTSYIPFRSVDAAGNLRPTARGTFVVRTAAPNPLALASTLRREVARERSDFRVSNIRAQSEINQSATLRERLLARLAFFFALVAILLACVGIYGVLDYSVVQRRREIAIRMAVGARAIDITRRVTLQVLSIVIAGSVTGLLLGIVIARYVQILLFHVGVSDPTLLVFAVSQIMIAALVSALRPVMRAVHIDPAELLRVE